MKVPTRRGGSLQRSCLKIVTTVKLKNGSIRLEYRTSFTKKWENTSQLIVQDG